MKGDNHISICTWNLRGFPSSIPYLRKLVTTHDIVLVSEHWLHANQINRMEEISTKASYFVRASNEAGADKYGISRGEGGVAIIWRKEMKGVTPLMEITHDRICGIRVQMEDKVVLNIFSVYLPSKGCKGSLEGSKGELSAILEGVEHGSINIVGGDFNGDVGSKGGPRGLKKATPEGAMVFDFAESYGLTFSNLQQYAKGPVNTHYGPTGSSCIDYILLPKDLEPMISKCSVVEEDPLNTSDY